jgi:hypothetical protein
MGRVLNRARKRQPAIPEDLLAHHLREDTSPGIDGGLRVGLWRNGISLGLDRSWEEHGNGATHCLTPEKAAPCTPVSTTGF